MADANDLMGIAKGYIPNLSTGFSYLTWLIIIIGIILLSGVAIYFILYRLRFKYKIIIFEEINNQFEPTRRDRAMEVKLSTAGDNIFYLDKHKKYLPTPSIQTGRKIFWYFIRSDGEWINFGVENLNEASQRVGARFLDKEMRYARTQIQRGLKERYDKPSFWQQYGLLIFSIGYIVIIGVMTFLLFDKWIDLAGVTNSGVETAGRIMEKVDTTLGKLDSVCSGGSGFKSTG